MDKNRVTSYDFNLLGAIKKHMKLFLAILTIVNIVGVVIAVMMPKKFKSKAFISPPRYSMYAPAILILNEIAPKDERHDAYIFKRFLSLVGARASEIEFSEVNSEFFKPEGAAVPDFVSVKFTPPMDRAEIILVWSKINQVADMLRKYLEFSVSRMRESLKRDVQARMKVLESKAESLRYAEKVRSSNKIERIKSVLAKQTPVFQPNIGLTFNFFGASLPEELFTRDFLAKEIETLKNRENDDIYIQELPSILTEINFLGQALDKIDGVEVYTLDTAPTKAERSFLSLPILLMVTFLLSILLALLVVLVREELCGE